jgi:transcriptional regulator with XRE-family HTH domain
MPAKGKQPKRDRILRRLAELGLTQEQFAQRVGLQGRQAVNVALRQGWSPARAQRWAQALDLPVDEILAKR